MLARIAWRNLWRHGRRSLITSGAMGLGVALVMFMMTYSDGVYLKMFDVLVSQKLGHVQVHHPDYPKKKSLHDTIDDGSELLAAIDAVDLTQVAAPRLYAYGLLASAKTSSGGQLLGIEPSREDRLSGLGSDLVSGVYAVGGSKVLIGKGLGDTLGIGVGDELIVIVQAADGSMGNELYQVGGVFKTGNAALDRAGAVLALEDLQRLVALEGGIHEILALTEDAQDSALLRDAVAALPAAQGKLVRTWSEADPTAGQMMAMQDVGAFIMLFFVLTLASFGVLNTMLMAVFERTRELGVLRALGLTPGQLVKMILLESLLLGVLACVAGLVFGGALDYYAVHYGIDMSMGQGGGFEYEGVEFDPIVMGVVRPEGIVLTVVMVMLTSLLASLWPAFRAARLRPVDAMREA